MHGANRMHLHLPRAEDCPLSKAIDRRAGQGPPTVMGQNSLVVRAGGPGSGSLQQGGDGPSGAALQGGVALLAQTPHQRLDDGVQLGRQRPACHSRCRDTPCSNTQNFISRPEWARQPWVGSAQASHHALRATETWCTKICNNQIVETEILAWQGTASEVRYYGRI